VPAAQRLPRHPEITAEISRLSAEMRERERAELCPVQAHRQTDSRAVSGTGT